MKEDELRDLVARVLGRRRVPESGDFSLRDAGLDSLGMIDLVGAIEQELGVRVTPEDIAPENFTSFSTLTAFVASRKGQRA